MQVRYHSQIQPTLACPNIADVASLFLVWRICHEVTIQQIGRDVELVIAVPLSAGCSAIACRAMVVTLCLRVRTTDMQFWRVHCLVVAACSDERETANTTMANIQANFLQLFGHARPVMAAQARTRLHFDMCKRDQIRPLPAAGGAASEGAQTARADLHNLAHMLYGKRGLVLFDELKPHRF